MDNKLNILMSKALEFHNIRDDFVKHMKDGKSLDDERREAVERFFGMQDIQLQCANLGSALRVLWKAIDEEIVDEDDVSRTLCMLSEQAGAIAEYASMVACQPLLLEEDNRMRAAEG